MLVNRLNFGIVPKNGGLRGDFQIVDLKSLYMSEVSLELRLNSEDHCLIVETLV